MDDRDWNVLIKVIEEGNCILMLGPEIAVKSGDKPARPLIEFFANELANEIASDIESLDRNNLAQMAQKFSAQEGVFDLQYMAEEFFDNHTQLHCDIHTTLATLPFHLIVKTTQDHLFIQGLQTCKKAYTEEWYNFHGGRKEIEVEGSQEHPLVYSLYGNIKEPQSLVLSENDLLDFLVAVISKAPPIPTYLGSEFTERDRCFLFVGFGFINWYLRILLHVLQQGNRKGRSFAMEEFVDHQDPRYRNAVLFFKDQYRIKFYHQSLLAFVRELKRRYDERKERIPDENSETYPDIDAPTVFLCHANEDKAFAEQLHRRLQKAGFNPWLDKENIRGGDLWDRRVEATIEKVDYFVVVQSKALETKIEGYVNKEIDLAINRQKRVQKLFKFIIPIQIEDCTPLQELREWQTIDFTQEDKTDKLISDIWRDRERRRKY